MKTPRILIVDDKEENLYCLRALMQGHGFEVYEARNGADALQMARQSQPDLIVSDILMPVMDGFALCREWKKDDRLKSIPFVLYTATYTDLWDEEFALKIGADRFIRKPCEPDAFMEAIRKVMEAARSGDIVSEPPQEEEEDVLRLYNRSLVRKLERKMMQLEKEVMARRETESALRESEEKHRRLFETMPQGVVYQDWEGGIIDANPASELLLGLSLDQMKGRTSSDPCWRSVHADGSAYPGERHPSMVALRTGQPVKDAIMGVYNPREDRMRWIKIDATPLFKPGEDKPYQVYTTFDDITARRQAENALIESREYLYKIINSIGDPIFVKDREHKLMLVNDALCLFAGRLREELLGKVLFEPLPEVLTDSLWKNEEDVFISGKDNIVEDQFTDERGGVHTIMTRKSLLVDKSGNKQIVGVLRDITEYKRLESRYFQAQKMEAVGVLAGGVAHDFNNLLTVINGCTEILLEDSAQSDSNRQDLEQIKKAGQQAASLTTQLLAFSRKQILQPIVLNLNDAIDEVGKMLRRLIGEDIELLTIAHPHLGLINADPGQIQQIVMNLAVNARDAMPQGGKFTIETANVNIDEDSVREHVIMEAGPYVMLAISDNGIGMDAATQARIFEPFFTTKGKGKGTGLGLSTVYGIVKQSNGFIWVYSELGKGSTFKIYFPRVEGANDEIKEKIAAATESGGSETLLIVEDENAVRDLTGRILRERGYNVLEASNGSEALIVAGEYGEKIHLVLTDVIMPGMNGRDLVAKLEVVRPGVKALFVSGYTDNVIVHHGILDSSFAFLQKPFTVESLVCKVREVLRR